MEVEAEVDPYLEVTEIVDRVVKGGGPALLFRNVKGSERPLLINQFGTERRMCLAFGEESLDAVARKLEDVLEMQPPQGLVEKVKGLGKLKRLADSHAEDGVEGRLPGARARARPRRAPDPALLARRPGAVHHAPGSDHEGPAHRRPQRRHVPDAEDRRALDVHALADPQGRARRLARRRGLDPGRRRARARPDHRVLGERAAPEAHRRADARGLPARRGGRDREVQDGRPRGAGQRRDRARGDDRGRRHGRRGPVRRPHRLLLAARAVPDLPPDRA